MINGLVQRSVLTQFYGIGTLCLHSITPLQTQFPHLKHGDTENQLAGVVIRIK